MPTSRKTAARCFEGLRRTARDSRRGRHMRRSGICSGARGGRPTPASSEAAARAGNTIALTTISLAEIVYLVEKHRIDESAYLDLRTMLNNADYVLEEVPLTGGIVETMRQVPRADVPDLPDRVVGLGLRRRAESARSAALAAVRHLGCACPPTRAWRRRATVREAEIQLTRRRDPEMWLLEHLRCSRGAVAPLSRTHERPARGDLRPASDFPRRIWTDTGEAEPNCGTAPARPLTA